MSTSRLRRGANIRSINRERYHGPAGPPRGMKTLCEKSVGRRRRPRRTSLRLVNWTSRRLVLRYCVRHGRSSGSIIWTASSRELVGAGRRIAQDLHQGLDLAVVEAIETADRKSTRLNSSHL